MTERVYTYAAVIRGTEVELKLPVLLREGDDVKIRGETFQITKVVSAVAPAVLPRIYLRRLK